MNTPPTVVELDTLWNQLAENDHPDRPGRQMRRVIPAARYDTFVAVDFPSRTRLLSVVAEGARLVPSAGERALTTGILLTLGSAPVSGHATVDLVLRDDAYTEIFTALVADLLMALATAGQGATAAELLLARLDDWRGLFTSVRPSGLRPERQRGLFGELVVLHEVLLPFVGAPVVSAWTGPDRQLQDFQFPTAAVEVKTVSGNNAEAVRITNERQLDSSRIGRLFLVTLALDARQGGSGVSLPDKVISIRGDQRLRRSLTGFDERLVRAGYLATQAHLYEDRRYTVRQMLIHLVGPDFPAIREEDLQQGVYDVSYTVDLLAAAPFLTTEHSLLASLGVTS